MINLLPPDNKSSYVYARRNVILRRWVVAFLIAFAGLGIIATYGFLNLHQSTKDYQKQVADAEKILQQENFTQTQKQIEDISGSFKLVVKVLSQEVLFSQLLKQIAATIPSKASLTGLTISQTTGGIDISAMAPDYNTATQVQVNLADPDNKIFSKADIISITCTRENAPDPARPCTVVVRALFAPDNPFLFINQGKKS